jgi:hypothetical protein
VSLIARSVTYGETVIHCRSNSTNQFEYGQAIIDAVSIGSILWIGVAS